MLHGILCALMMGLCGAEAQTPPPTAARFSISEESGRREVARD